MYEISCEMCMDLMPLVRDGVASDDSRASVEAHIAGCEACRSIWEAPAPKPDEDHALKKMVRRIQIVSFGVLAALLIWAMVTMSMFFGELAILYAMLCMLTFAALRGAFKKGRKLPAKIGAVVLAVVIAVVGNMLAGNPVSWVLAKNAVDQYLEETYPGNDYTVEQVTYNFINGNYYAPVASKSSIDTHFTVYIDLVGRVRYDTYDSVTDGWNTKNRLSEEYWNRVKAVKPAIAQHYMVDIWHGDLEIWTKQAVGADDIPDYALWIEDLVIDGEYDINQLGGQAGKLVVYIWDEQVDAQRAAQILLDIRRTMDEAEISFRAVDLVLEYPKQEDGTKQEGRIEIMDFAYADIYEDGLTERVEQANREAIAYYEAMDAEGK